MTKLDACPNCSAPFYGEKNFCANCGQQNRQIDLPVWALLGEMTQELLNFDSKIGRTLRILAFQPGQLTLYFNLGKRASYVPPLRLYLSISVLFFLILSMNQSREVDQMDAERQDTSRSNKFSIELVVKRYTFTSRELKRMEHLSDTQLDSLIQANHQTPDPVSRIVLRAAPKIGTTAGLNRFLADLSGNMSLTMFLLMPVFAGLLSLFYRSQKRYYVQHLIHSIHLHSIFFLLLLLGQVFYRLSSFSVTNSALLVGVVYSWFSLKKVYQESWGWTTTKVIGLAASQVILVLTILLGVTLISLRNM